MKTTYSVTFNYPNGGSFVIIETANLADAVNTYNSTSPADANHPDFRDVEEIEVELCKFTQEEDEKPELTEWEANEAFTGSQKGWIIK